MKTPVDRNDAPLSAYLLKILTILVKKAGGEIRIDATDMLEEADGEGLSKRYDRDKKQLVVNFIPSGSEIFFNKSEDQWLSQMDPLNRSHQPSSQVNRSRSSILQPLRQSDLTADYQSSLETPQRSASTLDDSRLADLEDHLRKEAAARLVANFPSTPVTEPRSQPRPPSQRRVQPSYFKG